MKLSDSMHPAYHLRPNKAVDRLLFVELLRALELSALGLPITYVGLGGPFLEDFRLLSREFPALELVCVERDPETLKRQEFHACSSRLVCRQGTLGDYVADCFPTDQPVAVWADFTDMRRECLSEFSDIVRKAVPGSMIRITVRAESPARKLYFHMAKHPERIPKKRQKDFEKIKDAHLVDMAVHGVSFREEWFEWAGFSPDRYPQVLANMIEATAQASCTGAKAFAPVHSVKYSDGTIMLSKTGVVCEEKNKASLAQHFMESCGFCSANPADVDAIDVPILTTKERLHLESVLPVEQPNGKACVKKLGYLIEGDEGELLSLRKLEQYERYHNLYPHFGKIVP